MDAKAKGVALLLIDIQHDFIDGSLAVSRAREILPVVTELLDMEWDMVVASQDCHPSDHISFASHHNVEPFQLRDVPHPHIAGETVSQMMWPDHCVQGTRGCELEVNLQRKLEGLSGYHLIKKGTERNVDAYSAFSNNHYASFTPLSALLFSGGRMGNEIGQTVSPPIGTVVIVGLATDYCVLSTAVDARKFGLRTLLVRDGVRGVDAKGSEDALARMEQWGCEIVTLVEVADLLKSR